MTALYVLAHFDDEYLILPMIRRDLAAGRDVRLFHLVDYRSAPMAARRHRETLGLLAGIGVGPEKQLHLGAGTGWFDGELHRHIEAVWPALLAAAWALPPIERLVTPAWEGGHPDHDICAALTVKLAGELGGPPIDQFCLYQGRNLPWLFYRACCPIPENGPTRVIELTAKQWACWAWRVTAFPSQLKVWSGLGPAMAATFMLQRGFRHQQLAPARIGERPHAGPLLYERMFKTPYAVIRAAADRL